MISSAIYFTLSLTCPANHEFQFYVVRRTLLVTLPINSKTAIQEGMKRTIQVNVKMT